MTDDTIIGEDIENPATWLISGNDFFKNGQYEEAKKCYFNAIELNPQYLDAWNNLGFTYFKLGKTEEANKCKEKIKEIKLKSSEPPILTESQSAVRESIDNNELKEKYVNGEITYNQYQNILEGKIEYSEFINSTTVNKITNSSGEKEESDKSFKEKEKSETKPIHWIIGILIVIGSLVLFGPFGLLITVFLCLFYAWWKDYYSPTETESSKKSSLSSIVIIVVLFILFLAILGGVISSISR